MAQNLFDINGKVTVMTGACGVLGATIVKYFASQGSKVVLLDLERARETGEKIVAEIKAAGGEAMFLPTNVLDEATVEQNCKDIVAAYGSVDILLNGAGGNMGPANVAPDQTIFDMDLDATRKVFELNIIGAIIPTKVFAKVMVANKKGSIVNFCSMSSFRPLTRVAGYGMAKSALASWTQWLAGGHQIRRRPARECHRPGLPAHQPEPQPAHQPGRFADRPFPQDHRPYAVWTVPGAGRAGGSITLPGQRRFQRRHRHHRSCGRRL